MKNILYLILLYWSTTFLLSQSNATTQSGSWTSCNTWGNPSAINNSTGTTFTINDGHTVDSNATWSAAAINLDGNGAVDLNTGLFIDLTNNTGNSKSCAEVSIVIDTPGDHTFNIPSGVTKFIIETWGAGGGGGTANIAQTGTFMSYGGHGGGGGGYSKRTFNVVSGQTAASLHVGTGGTGGMAGGIGDSGHDGGDSSASYNGIIITGGGGGRGITSTTGSISSSFNAACEGLPGDGGVASGGEVNSSGSAAIFNNNNGTNSTVVSGTSGGSAGNTTATGGAGSTDPFTSGGNGGTPGCGGGGGSARGTGSLWSNGGTGANGRIIVRYFP